LRDWGTKVANVAVLALAWVMLVVWMHDRAQADIGYMGLCAAAWSLHTLMMIEPDPWFDLVWWREISFILSMVSCAAISLFIFRFSGPRRAVIEGSILGFLVLACLADIIFKSHTSMILAYGGVGLIWPVATLYGVWRMAITRRPSGWLLVLGLVTVMITGQHDVLVMFRVLPFDSVYWVLLSVPFLVFCVGYILAGDYARARRGLHDLNVNLAVKVQEREQALRNSFQRLAALEQAQAVSAERSRILKDMHDGVGTHLTSALRQLQGQSGHEVDVPLVTQTLRDSLDQLKLSIDALSLVPGDVAGLLASWRFRLAPRLKAAGIELNWDVEPLPSWPEGQSPALRHLQYILFEGLSNVLQHSHANQLVVSARDLGHCIRISLIDNGHGWHRSGAHEGQGLQTMRSRAGAIGATLEFLPSSQGGLELRLSLPMYQTAQAIDISTAA
jgi:signal transduction histidine kinase